MGSPRAISRLTFWLGGLAAVAVGPALVSVALGVLARRGGLGDAGAAEDTRLFVALGYSGLPAFVTGGGVARLVAHRRHDDGARARLWRDLARGASAMALAGIGLAVLAAVPLGGLPIESARWAPLALVGIACGVPTGLAVAALAGVRQRVYATRVLAPPAEAAEPAKAARPVEPTATDVVSPLPPSELTDATPTPITTVAVVPERDWSRPQPTSEDSSSGLELEATTRRPLPTSSEVVVPPRPKHKKRRRKGRR